MSRRGRNPLPANNGFMAAVSDNLDRLEQAVAYQTVKIEFTGLDVARWLLPPEHLELLAAVFRRATRDHIRAVQMSVTALVTPTILWHDFV